MKMKKRMMKMEKVMRSTSVSVSPTTTTCCFPSSSTRSFDFPDSRSNTCPWITLGRCSKWSLCHLSTVDLKVAARDNEVVVFVFWRLEQFEDVPRGKSINSVL